MIQQIFHSIYVLDLWVIALIIAALIVAWSGLSLLLQQHMRRLAVILALLSLAAILFVTLFSRSPMAAEIRPIPFSAFSRDVTRPEIYRSMLMNLLLFVPLGLSLPFVLRGSTAKRILLTVLIGFLLSVSIETIQYLFSLGLAEADDVLCNTLGAVLGACAYPMSLHWTKCRKSLDKARGKDDNA